MKPSAKQRVDQLMVDRGLAESRQKAQALVLAGEVTVNGRPVDKPGRAVALDADIRVKARPKYVSRGGLKLEAALETFGVDPDGKVCIDVGASTGGFTDCLLQRGASTPWTPGRARFIGGCAMIRGSRCARTRTRGASNPPT